MQNDPHKEEETPRNSSPVCYLDNPDIQPAYRLLSSNAEDGTVKNTSPQRSLKVQSPGRINLIGEHTDYNHGFVLPAAIDKRAVMQLTSNPLSDRASFIAENIGEQFSFQLNDFSPLPGGWQNYVMGVVHELQQLGGQIGGFEATFSGNVPIGGGMSSSAALECALAFALNELFELGFDTFQLIKASQMAEHHFVGIKCGIMDQFASMMGKKDQVLLLDCRSLQHQYFPLHLGDYQLLLLNTNVSHSLASSAYNTRQAECEEGVRILQKSIPGITHLRDVSLRQLQDHQKELPAVIYQRCHHVISENERVLAATQALSTGNLAILGQLMYQSHQSLQYDYAVSCPELDFLVQSTRQNSSILGSRMMGGGFGGCTINLVKSSEAEAFIEQIEKAYRTQFGFELTPYQVSIEDGTSVV